MIKIVPYENYHEHEIISLYDSVGWKRYVQNPDVLRKGFECSLHVLAAYEDDKLVGILRAVGDGCTIVYIQDVLVHPQYQHQKIGSMLLKRTLETYKDVYQIVLLTDHMEKNIRFYEKADLKNVEDMHCICFAHCK